jgi:DNA-3-methyladenine glycosylase II
VLLLDHPGWIGSAADGHRRVVRTGHAVWLIVAGVEGSVSISRVHGEGGSAPRVDAFDPGRLSADRRLTGPLQLVGVVSRLRNPDLWDAIANSIIRQVIRTGTARDMYRLFCAEHGEAIATHHGVCRLIPAPGKVAVLGDDDFARIGMRFKAFALRAAARAYLAHHRQWASMPAERLLNVIQQVPRIGPWTAGASVADHTNDYRHYPFGDLAVRTWASKIAPGLNMPDGEKAFAHRWGALGEGAVSELTLLTLAWGVRHAGAG